MGKLNWHFKGCDGSHRTMQVSKIYGSHGDSEREANTDRKLERESERDGVYSERYTVTP